MDLEARKYLFIKELFSIDKESIIDVLEQVLKREKEQHQGISSEQKEELNNRLKSYKDTPEDLLNWEDVKNDW
ncbi:addiction module protein [Tamlana sp. 2_MG-2023]|uniref:addiction module protein n=1 Tax=unclassified Tamlana TaxID=2614803 RepID=UPI0026E2CD05|nr:MULTISPECIES: addiction module protein [unclassified Tamlana]MDO6761081.1 addiction module protein [Tamlana sp. 2_MG-2023]MDO6791586.1 addiction module protein [Tamlana sp. 1_MG-2023]